MEIKELQPQDKARWDAYVTGAPQATIYHLSSWKEVMEEALGLSTHFLYASEDGQVLGVLPLLRVKSPLSGHFITSMPGAVCATDTAVAQALIEQAKDLTRAGGARYLALRDSLRAWDFPNLVTDNSHCTLVVKLVPDLNRLWSATARTAQRETRKAMEADVEVRRGQAYLEAYYPVYARAMREVGTPTLGVRFFRTIMQELAEYFDVTVVVKDDQILGGGFTARFQDTIFDTWGGMLREYYDLRTNYILHWEILKYGAVNGFQWVDMGRSKWDSGTYRFKQHWRPEPRPLYQQFFLNRVSQPPPVGGGREDEANYRAFVKVWRQLPLKTTEILGPWLRKQMPFG